MGEQEADFLDDLLVGIIRVGDQHLATRHDGRPHIGQTVEPVHQFGALEIVEPVLWQ